ncbi:MAG: DUF6599 family protein [Candidatus Saccharicenans sp.]
MDRKAFYILVIYLLLVLLPASMMAADSGQALSLKSLLPKIEGWEFQEEPALYSPGTLFEYINGASEAYLSYDFRELIVAHYQKKGSETTVTLEIYDMGEALNAFGIFSSERYPESPEVNIGYAGYLEEEVLNFVSGRYYVKLICYEGGEQTPEYLQMFAREVQAKIGDKGGLSALFSAFPPEGRVKNSEKFIKKNFMGFDFLSRGYVVYYRNDGVEYEGFIIECNSPAEADSSLKKLVEFYSREKYPFVREGNRYYQKNAYGQHVLLSQSGRYLFGFSRVPENLLPLVLKNLEKIGQALSAQRSR